MTPVPVDLPAAVAAALAATERALADGLTRLQIELLIPEIALEAQELARQFTPLFASAGPNLRVLFPDAGAAALARRDWGETVFQVGDLGSRNTPVDSKIAPEDEAYLVVGASAVEVNTVERLCELAEHRPVVLLIPQLEDVSIVGIGYAARQLRERFLSSLTSSYYFRPLDGAAVLRDYPSLWRVYQQDEDGAYQLLTERGEKPLGEALERLLAGDQETGASAENCPRKAGLFAQVGQFLKALSS